MKVGSCSMRPEDAPPGFWQWPPDAPVLAEGVEFHSAVPTRFFQTVDEYPPEWGRLVWRIQVNAIVAGKAALPVFRTFYPGVEWNLKRSDHRWFLTAWFRWEGPGPPPQQAAEVAPSIAHDSVLFAFASSPRLFLRSRIDARDRRSISESLREEQDRERQSSSDVILLDDVMHSNG